MTPWFHLSKVDELQGKILCRGDVFSFLSIQVQVTRQIMWAARSVRFAPKSGFSDINTLCKIAVTTDRL